MSGSNLKTLVKQSIARGANFLLANQLDSGEFVTMMARQESMLNAIQVKSVFPSSFVLHSIKFLRNCPEVEAIAQKALRFVLNERGKDGLWRGLSSPFVPPDIDCICCVLASLKEWQVPLDFNAYARRLLNYRLEQGAFFTWVLDTDPGVVRLPNDLDWVVNANVLFFYSLVGYPLPAVKAYLEEVVSRQLFGNGSRYYPSSFVFTYCLSRAVVDGGARNLTGTLGRLSQYMESLRISGSEGTALDTALAAATLLNCSGKGSLIERGIYRLLLLQQSDGGWPLASFFTAPRGYYYGSRALTTAVAMEALAKSLITTKDFD